ERQYYRFLLLRVVSPVSVPTSLRSIRIRKASFRPLDFQLSGAGLAIARHLDFALHFVSGNHQVEPDRLALVLNFDRDFVPGNGPFFQWELLSIIRAGGSGNFPSGLLQNEQSRRSIPVSFGSCPHEGPRPLARNIDIRGNRQRYRD